MEPPIFGVSKPCTTGCMALGITPMNQVEPRARNATRNLLFVFFLFSAAHIGAMVIILWNAVPTLCTCILLKTSSSTAQCENVVSGFVPRVYTIGGLGLITQVISRACTDRHAFGKQPCYLQYIW